MIGFRYTLILLAITSCVRFRTETLDPKTLTMPLIFLDQKNIRRVEIWSSKADFIKECPNAVLIPNGNFLIFRYGLRVNNTYIKSVLVNERIATITLNVDEFHDTDKGYPILMDNSSLITNMIFILDDLTNFITNVTY